MPFVKRIDHVAIVVEDIETALNFWRDGLGLKVSHVEDVPEMQSKVAFLETGYSEIELVKPTDDESGIYRFLKEHGPSMHHICLEVNDIQAFINHLVKQGVQMINTEPVVGTGGRLIAFIHPKSAHGVLVELYELTGQELEIRPQRSRPLVLRLLSWLRAALSSAIHRRRRNH
ncbi:MAG: methylmalonyl-CoA epimerase [Anaerolineales bacterium]|jgi:methylmalonyl-CoA/ethylmalonyl-CoA epimerase